MQPMKLETKHFTLEIYRRGIVFSIASLLLMSGLNLCNGNILLLIISIFNKQVYNKESNEYGFWIGFILILISLFLFYLIIINWRIEIYSKVFLQLRMTIDKYGTLVNYRYHYIKSDKLQKLKLEVYQTYIETTTFLGENQTYIDIETYELARNVNHEIGKSLLEFDTYIKQIRKIETNEDVGNYDPELANKALMGDVSLITEQFSNFVTIIKEKEKFKLSK